MLTTQHDPIVLESIQPHEPHVPVRVGGAWCARQGWALAVCRHRNQQQRPPSRPFNPYVDNLHFLFAAYILEDVVPTGWEVRLRNRSGTLQAELLECLAKVVDTCSKTQIYPRELNFAYIGQLRHMIFYIA